MELLEIAALIALLVVVSLIFLYVRRLLILRSGGTVELSLRLSARTHGRGWALGIGRFTGDRLLWYRMFSVAPRPRRIFARSELAVAARRPPVGSESLALLRGSVVLRCRTPRGEVELAMTEQALTGFLSWLEAAPPGVSLPPYRAS